jgi:glutamate racemase
MSEKSAPKNKAVKKSEVPANLIGVFDSGLGGLSVFQHFLKDLPNYNYLYLGDNARLPYGEKSPDTIYQYTKEAVDYLFSAGCNLIIIACNTASAQALRRLQQEYLPKYYPDRRILGVIRPLVEAAVQRSNLKKVGVIGTKATINSRAYSLEIKKLNPTIQVIEQAAPLLVPLIEEGWAKKSVTRMILKKYLQPLKARQIQALILGCTHYPFLLTAIKEIVGRRIVVFQPGEIIATSLKKYLNRHPELGLREVSQPSRQFRTTDSPELFQTLGEKFLDQKITNLTRVQITEL